MVLFWYRWGVLAWLPAKRYLFSEAQAAPSSACMSKALTNPAHFSLQTLHYFWPSHWCFVWWDWRAKPSGCCDAALTFPNKNGVVHPVVQDVALLWGQHGLFEGTAWSHAGHFHWTRCIRDLQQNKKRSHNTLFFLNSRFELKYSDQISEFHSWPCRGQPSSCWSSPLSHHQECWGRWCLYFPVPAQ